MAELEPIVGRYLSLSFDGLSEIDVVNQRPMNFISGSA
jgi:hypothetical protein